MDLRAAAERLGVHYQTAYKWVRTGVLPAAKVGSSYEVAEADVDRLHKARTEPAPPPRTLVVRSWDDQVERLCQALVAGDELAARQLVDRLEEGAVGLLDLCERLLSPALVRIGEGWAAGEVTVAEEHRASAIVDRLVGRLSVHPTGRPRGVAVVATAPGEEHGLAAAMAAACLRGDRWQVHHLGTQVPTADLLELVRSVDATLLVLSVINPAAAAASEEAAAAVRSTLGVPVLIGRPGEQLRDLLDHARATTASSRGAPTADG